MILIDKLTKILKNLYPYGVDTSRICDIYENVIPEIRKLIISAENVHVAPTVPHMNLADQIEPVFIGDHVPTEPIKVETPVANDLDFVKPVQCDRGATIFFNENNDKHATNEDWTKTEYGGPIHYKHGDDIFIRGDSCTINTSWEYLKEFFDCLPDETVLMRVEGMNKKKLSTLFKFYEAHPNWSCHVEKSNGVNVFMKDEVRVNSVTAVSGDGGAMDIDSYNGVGED